MAEENQQQVKQEPQRVTKEQQRVTMKDLKKVEAGNRLAAINHKKREARKAKSEGVNQYYGIGVVLAVGMIGGFGYYIYQSKKGEEVKDASITCNPTVSQQPSTKTNKFDHINV